MVSLPPGGTDKGSESPSEIRERLALLGDSVNRFAARDVHVKRARALRGTRPGYNRGVWREMAELGWLGTLIPERFGGIGLGCAEMATICEVLGRSLFPEPITAAVVLAGGALLYGDNEALKSELLPGLARGQMIPALAWRENVHHCNFLAVDTRAEETPHGVRIFGTKRLVVGSVSADGFVVSAQSRGGIALYWVPSAAVAPGLSFRELPDGRPMADLTLSGVEVPASHRIASAGIAKTALARAFDEALIMTAAELLGVSTRTLEITLDYLRTRVQFGKPIGSFQALQHRMVDLYIEQRICRHVMDDVLSTIQKPDLQSDMRGALASRIKSRCADASLRITRGAVQMHGAMGFSDECDVGLYLKRAITLSMWLGSTDVHRRRYAKLALNEMAG